VQALIKHISKELRIEPHCGVYDTDLERVWPKTGKPRELEIRKFASQHGWQVLFYKEGFCAIFAKIVRDRQKKV